MSRLRRSEVPGFSGTRQRPAPDLVNRRILAQGPDQLWLADMTYVPTRHGFLYLAVVVDAFSRKVVGWSMKPTLSRELALDALLMAVWRRKPEQRVIVHSDQGCQFTSHEWQDFLKSHKLQPSMSRRGNCHDNAVAESFFQLLKRERIITTPQGANVHVSTGEDVVIMCANNYLGLSSHPDVVEAERVEHLRRHLDRGRLGPRRIGRPGIRACPQGAFPMAG